MFTLISVQITSDLCYDEIMETIKQETIDAIMALTPNDIEKVYKGKEGKCCCGCSGRYFYNKAHQKLGSDRRGYEVEDKECNNRKVLEVLKKVQDNVMTLTEDDYDHGNHVTFYENGKMFIAYFAN